MNTANNTKRIEISLDRERGPWLPCYVREAEVDVRPPDDAVLPEGHVWGKMGGQWVPVFDQAAC